MFTPNKGFCKGLLDEGNEAVVIRDFFDNETQLTDQRYKNMKL
jgi:hypothetical protein